MPVKQGCVEKWLEDFKSCCKSKSDLEHVQVQLAAVTQWTVNNSNTLRQVVYRHELAALLKYITTACQCLLSFRSLVKKWDTKSWTTAVCFYVHIIIMGVISSFCHKVNESCILLGYYTANSGNSLLTFQDNQPLLTAQQPRRMQL